METKYNIGQKVFTMLSNNPHKVKVTKITIDKAGDVFYQLDENHTKPESRIGETIDDLKRLVFD